MTLTDRYEPTLTEREIITRSDHAPSSNERYGDWARKFFGYGCHHQYQDNHTALAYAGGPTSDVPVRH